MIVNLNTSEYNQYITRYLADEWNICWTLQFKIAVVEVT